MFYFYVLQSLRDEDLYFGYTADLHKRVSEHNKGYTASTKRRVPFKLVYYEAYDNKKDALEREKQIKQRAGALSGLKRRLKNSL